jgi:subtilisin family serine protease
MTTKSKKILMFLSVIPMLLGFYCNSSAGPLEADLRDLPVVAVSGTLEKQPLPLNAMVPQTKHAKLDPVLSGLVQLQTSPATDMSRFAESNRLNLVAGRVHVQVLTDRNNIYTVIQTIKDAGGEATGTGVLNKVVQAWLPVEALETIAGREDVHFIRTPADAVLFEGASETEGIDDINASDWHAAGTIGDGVKIAVVDAGFVGYTDFLGTDLPASVTVANFVDGETDADVGSGSTPHGTACAEVIYDLAPGASISLVKISTNVDLNEAKNWAIANDIDVISTSLGWYNLTPGDGTGEFETIVQQARAAGIIWCTAASNDRENHWGGAFNDASENGYHEFSGTQEVNYFGPGDGNAYVLYAGVPLRAFLRWDDWTNVTEDYKLRIWCFVNGAWYWAAESDNPQTGQAGQTPTEYLSIVTPVEAPYGYTIERKAGTRNVNLELLCPKSPRLDEVLHARSLSNLADSPSAITVAALDVNPPYPQENYSSEGPVNGPGGTAIGALFVKPDVSAYANVSTESYGAGVFNGTSSATPHVAGAAALILSAYPDYTPDDIQDHIEDQAVDMGVAGEDTVYGWGRLVLGDAPTGDCMGDYDTDNDVDGSDLAALASDPLKLMDLDEFKDNFGKPCG